MTRIQRTRDNENLYYEATNRVVINNGEVVKDTLNYVEEKCHDYFLSLDKEHRKIFALWCMLFEQYKNDTEIAFNKINNYSIEPEYKEAMSHLKYYGVRNCSIRKTIFKGDWK